MGGDKRGPRAGAAPFPAKMPAARPLHDVGAGTMSVANVIVADDEALLRWAITQRLERDGHVVTETGDGAATLAAIDVVEAPAVVVLDVKLPDMPGLAVLQEIRRRRPDVGVVMMTAYWASEALAEARRLGVREMFAKPLDLERMAAAVSAVKELGTC